MFCFWVSGVVAITFASMFVRQKKNKSGVISVQVIDKSRGRYRVKKTLGSSSDLSVVEELLRQGHLFIDQYKGQPALDFILGDDDHYYQSIYDNIKQVQLLGPELVLGKLFNAIGFNAIKDDLFRHLVIARIVYPVSKLKTAAYLHQYKGISIDVNELYRYLDKLQQGQIKQVKQISYEHTIKILGGQLSIVFYDVTTIYFEAEQEDELRKTGFSKDGKHQQPQIVLGLLVSENGYPLDYEIFEGDKFEGHTMLPVVEAFKEKYQLQQLIVVADAGLMSNKNIEELTNKGYDYIIGARIKNETQAITNQLLALTLEDGKSIAIQRSILQRIIISYSESRAKNDAHNREKGMERLKKQLAKGKLTKQHINNRGYNKYLKLEGEIKITFDEQKYEADAKWDGLKGYLTNTALSKETVINYYKQLWQIEKAFRISKTDLRIRPVYHYKKRRIEAHICIAFAACKLYKELERQLKEQQSKLSPEKVIDILKTIYGLTVQVPHSREYRLMLLDKTQEQKEILKMFP